jgi:hypothetical protein
MHKPYHKISYCIRDIHYNTVIAASIRPITTEAWQQMTGGIGSRLPDSFRNYDLLNTTQLKETFDD